MKTVAEIVREQRDHHGRPMQTFEINGRKVKTNLGAWQTRLWNGNEVPMRYTYWGNREGHNRPLEFRESMDEAFIKEFEAGYNEIQFVETSTCVRGYHHVYVWSCR